MRRLVLLGLLLFCLVSVGCSTFSTQSQKDFLSNDNALLSVEKDKPAP